MDARVNDFLNEIDEIAPLSESKAEIVWEKCLDEDSGYHYYWNTKTNEVTWDVPPDYRPVHKMKTKKSPNLYIPPRSAPLFPSASKLPPVSDAVKIYKIGDHTDTHANSDSKVRIDNTRDGSSEKEEMRTVIANTFSNKESDFREEKVVVISSHGDDSESEGETGKTVNGSKTQQSSTSASEDDDDVDIRTKIQKRATQLKKRDTVKPPTSLITSDLKKTSNYSLVVGYSDSEEDDLDESETDLQPPPEEKESHSTLFPVVKPIDIKDFDPPRGSEDFNSKAFQRKRRIGVALVNTGKKENVDDDGERKGLGFSSDSNSGDTYVGFKSGGVMFVKADTLINPSRNENDLEERSETTVLVDIEDTYVTLKEKLKFLSEGREEVSPVQVMLIQIETLYTAVKSGDLKQTYLRRWLDETCSDLIKLEKETAPEGWLLQWDRTHKRYYYQNAATGESQWEYPQADVTVCDEAMDICTTPPPNGAEPTIHMSPPLPPTISSPSPPPPPTISSKSHRKKKCDIPLPPEPRESMNVTVDRYDSNGEPLPPGVDIYDVASKLKDPNDINEVLSSFYSDIAAIERSDSPTIPNVGEEARGEVEGLTEPAKKKKKTKVKLAQGLAMKKKGVSKLVEKWKHVQMSYNE